MTSHGGLTLPLAIRSLIWEKIPSSCVLNTVLVETALLGTTELELAIEMFNSLSPAAVKDTLQLACLCNNSTTISRMVGLGLKLADVRKTGNFVLRHASLNGNTKIIKILLGLGLTVTDVRAHNNAPLKRASEVGHTEVVKLLLSTGLTMEDIQTDNNWAVRTAHTNGHVNIVKLLTEHR